MEEVANCLLELLRCPLPELSWGHAGVLPESGRKVALITKTEFQGDLRKGFPRCCRRGEDLLSPLQTETENIGMWRYAKGFLEGSIEVILAEACTRRYVG